MNYLKFVLLASIFLTADRGTCLDPNGKPLPPPGLAQEKESNQMDNEVRGAVATEASVNDEIPKTPDNPEFTPIKNKTPTSQIELTEDTNPPPESTPQKKSHTAN